MFHPIGSQPPQVYWRRRLLFAASLVLLVLLIVLTVNALTSSGKGATSAAGGTPTRTTVIPPPATPRSTAATRTSTTAKPSSSARSSSSAGSTAHSTSAPPPPACAADDLRVAAVPQHSNYHVGDRPVLQLRVTNIGAKPCVQDLADKQVELKVYNGESRVWGSHDCKTLPGTTPRTLAPNVPVLVALTWSGLTSQPACTGTRQRVGVGTYTLYGSLAGRTGTAGRFTIS